MKKAYISPSIHITRHRIEPCMDSLSGTNGQAIGEGDNITNGQQIGKGTEESDTGEGLNAKRGSFFYDGEW